MDYDKTQTLACYVCDKSFAKTSNLYKHIRDVHKENIHFPTRKIICPACQCKQFNTYEQLNQHLQNQHSIQIEIEKHTFNNTKEFEMWKKEKEENTISQYVKAAGIRRSGIFEKIHYNCNRTGFFQTEGERRRKLKSKGSCKINANCPSRIKVLRNCKNGSVQVDYVSTHVGHKQQLDHLVLTKSDRQWVYRQLVEGKNIDEILQLAHSNLVEKRLNLLTRKDILNIKSALGDPLIVTNEEATVPIEPDAGNLYICIDENGETRQIQVIKLITKVDSGLSKEVLKGDIGNQIEAINENINLIDDDDDVLQTVSSLLQMVNQYIRYRK